MAANSASVRVVLDELARDPLRNIVLLNHLTAYPERIVIHRATDGAKIATLVLLAAAASMTGNFIRTPPSSP